MGSGLLFALVMSVGVFYILFHLVRKASSLIWHAVLGMAIFIAINYLGIAQVPINWMTVAIAALAGTVGVFIVLGLTALGIPL